MDFDYFEIFEWTFRTGSWIRRFKLCLGIWFGDIYSVVLVCE